MPKEWFKCAYCGNEVKRWSKNPYGRIIENHFCNNTCKGSWQKKQREDLGYTKEWLYEEYVVKGRNCNDIAKEINRNSKRVWEWLKEYGIETRKRGYGNTDVWLKKGNKLCAGRKLSEEHKEKIRQARIKDGRVPYLKNGQHWLKQDGVHPASWRGGVTPERQSVYTSREWKDAVKKVWKRDNATCQLCGKHQADDRENKFHIHHIYPFAKYKHLRTNPDALVLLCPDCHHFVHSKRNTENKFMLKEAALPNWIYERNKR